jgi:hypothetical protein
MSNNEVKFKKKPLDKPKEELSKRSFQSAAGKLYELTVIEGRYQRSSTRSIIVEELKNPIQFTKKEIWYQMILKTFIQSHAEDVISVRSSNMFTKYSSN